MKKLLTALLAIAIVLSFPAGVDAGPALLVIAFEDFSDFNELRQMEKDAADGQLRDFLRRNRAVKAHHRKIFFI